MIETLMENDATLAFRILDQTPIGIIILTPMRTIRYANLYAVRIFGSDRRSLSGISIDTALVDCPGETAWHELWSAVITGRAGETMIAVSRPAGDQIICSVTAFFLPAHEGEEAVALIFKDQTSELKVAEQLEKKNIEMAKMNTELIRSNVELKRLAEMKSNFLSIASHELKTPLTSIKGYSDIIIDAMRDRLDEGVYRMIESINRAADRLHKVIDNILDVTRIEQKKLRLKPETFDLRQAALDCIEEVNQVAAKRHIGFTCLFADDVPDFCGDRQRMQQVFTNLFTNAIKFSPDGSTVDVSIAREDGEHIHIIVKDRGIGIDRIEHKHIFDPFYEVGDIRRHSTDQIKFLGSGTGLGLSIAKGIVERHNGRIWVESEGMNPNDFPGSQFHIVLPMNPATGSDNFERDELLPENVERREILRVRTDTENDEKPGILLVDSDRETVEVARMVLENAFEVIAAPTGEFGLSLAFQYHPSIILIDSLLPGLDPFRLCSLLRSQEETRETPVIFLSSVTDREEIEKCFAAGGDDFLIKPFSGRELILKIWQILMKKKTETYS
jgi:signal transduction histidine kinase